MESRTLGPDGALLCNFEATIFKLNFQRSRRAESFKCTFSHTPRILKHVYAGFRYMRCALSIRFINEQGGCQQYDHRIAFQRIARLGILQRAEK